MKQNLLIFWNRVWKYQIEAFNNNHVIYDIVDVCRNFDKNDFIGNGRNKFTYSGPEWDELTTDDEENISNLYRSVLEKNSYDYIVPAWMDSDLPGLALANEYFNLKGIKPNTLINVSGKSVYGEILKELNIPTPKIYKNINDTTFPVICKPSFGTGGIGIKICYDYEELSKFLNDSENQKHHPYIIQDYIIGTTVCVVGHITNKKVSIDLIHDIEITNPPYCAETGWTFPSPFAFIENSVQKDLELFSSHVNLNDTPFMLDLIVEPDGKYYFIDFSPRISYSIYQLMYYTCNADYFYNLVNKINNNVNFKVKKEKSYILRHFKLEVGEVESIEYTKNDNVMEITLPQSSDIIREIKNDFDIASNGYFCIIVGDTLIEVENSWEVLNNSIKIIYKT